jgi:hypothetical protein
MSRLRLLLRRADLRQLPLEATLRQLPRESALRRLPLEALCQLPLESARLEVAMRAALRPTVRLCPVRA